ncbi:diacylglycerol kinase [Sulfurospirillum arcachonense]|uniref:diacylglycerol kinase n=1 Tax=Sulfurospirillum arcachonense TaxID=57666 RepID=UPI0004697841|nr:diacylglycerol kinase [Sulfurospirillum arcachonense]
MQGINASNYSYNDFNLSMQTSSGDKIDLKLYDEKSSEVSYKQDENSTTMMLSLSHSYGYSFQYAGDGIDAQDQKEIDDAMKLVQPMLEKYFEEVNASEEDYSMAQITNKAFDINSYLPKAEDLNTKNYLSDSTLKTIDKLLEKAENQNEKTLQHAQKLFDALLKQMDRFELYI